MKILWRLCFSLIASLPLLAADVKISDLTEIASPSDNTWILVSDMDAATKSRKYRWTNFVLQADIGVSVQAFSANLANWSGLATSAKQDADADLTDLADGSLTGSKVGTGITADNITAGTLAEARVHADIARDAEVAAAYQPLTVGTVVNSGASSANAVPRYSDTTGTNVAPTSVTITSLTNLNAGSVSFNGDAIITREAANITAFKNGTAAQATRFYNTFTDASNYERVDMGWSGNAFFISPVNLGTGTGRSVQIGPGANNASGSVIFQTSNAQRWQVNPSGHMLAVTDNAVDIGASGATRPRDVYVADDVIAGGDGTFAGFLNTTFDAAATGNVLKQTRYLNFINPAYGDGAGAIPQTNNYTASGLMHYTFSGSAETNVNWVVYETSVPPDIDTGVAMTATLAFVSGGTDADDVTFHITYALGTAGTALPSGTSISTSPIVMTVTPTTPASGDVQTTAAVTLTGWAGSMTAGAPLFIRVARLNTTNDDTARDMYLRIAYGSTQ